MKHILFICTGNICRSPMAERIFAARMPPEKSGWTAASAGTAAATGWPASEEAVLALKERDIDLANHSSQPVSRDLLDIADLIVTMTARHKTEVLTLDPSKSDRVRLVTSFGTSDDPRDIPDPIGAPLDVYRHTRDVLESAIADIILYIKDTERPGEGQQEG